MNSSFRWSTANTAITYSDDNLIGIFCNEVSGVSIGGCTFKNDMGATLCLYERGVGIYSYKSNIQVSQGGDRFCTDDDGCPNNCNSGSSTGNLFEKISKGIKFETTTGLPKHFACRNSIFTNVIYGIQLINADKCGIAHNTFGVTRAGLDAIYTYGACYNPTTTINNEIIAENSTNLVIYDNDFTIENVNMRAITIDACGSTNPSEIVNNRINGTNTIYTSEVYGVQVLNNCEKLKITCNTFTTCGVDIMVDGGSLDLGISTPTSSKPGKNIFSNYSTSRYGIYNNFGLVSGNYYFHQGAGISSNEEPRTSSGISLTSTNTNTTNCSKSCNDYTEIKKIEKQILVNIYPNPSIGGRFRIDAKEKILNIRVYDVTLNKVLELDFDNQNLYTYDFSILGQPGLYFCEIEIRSGRIFSKLLKM